MSFLKKLHGLQSPISISIYNKDRTFSGGTVTESFPATADLTVNGYFWQGSRAEAVVSEKIRATIDGVLLIDYTDMTIAVEDGARAVLNGDTFDIVTEDDILFANEVLLYPVRKIN